MRPPEALRQAVRVRTCAAGADEQTRLLAERLAADAGGHARAIVFFGSRKTRAGADAWSAHDLFVLTAGYGGFYRALAAAGRVHRPAWLLAALNVWMPPNQAFFPLQLGAGGPRLLGKLAVVDLEALARETGEGRRDHFCIGRLFQPTEILYAADGATRERVLDALVSAHALTYEWVRPWLPEAFDVEAYCRAALRLSLSRELRPELGGRADALFEAQRDYLLPVYSVWLLELFRSGELLETEPGQYRLARPVAGAERRRLEAYFRRSKRRATLRWVKYVVTVEGWLDYIVRKAERHTGRRLELSPRERRWPLIFLWPRVIRYLRGKDRPFP